jgi:hypothetical protein
MSEVAFSVATPMALVLAGIIHLTKKVCHADDAWADENGGVEATEHGFTVNAICPG